MGPSGSPFTHSNKDGDFPPVFLVTLIRCATEFAIGKDHEVLPFRVASFGSARGTSRPDPAVR